MKSPFPGMDPYLEAHWRDVHASLILYARDQIQRQLGGDLRARVEERLIVESDPPAVRDVYPDVRVIETYPTGRLARATGGMLVAEPVLVIRGKSEQRTETFIKVIDVGTGGRVVTVIEFLSLTNKTPGKDRKQYLRKKTELLSGHVNFVEIDLLRSGQRTFGQGEKLKPQHRRAYQACITRAHSLPREAIYAFPLEEKLPALPIPLRAKEKDVYLNLQRVVAMAYENGAYDDLDYSQPPEPPLDDEHVDWVAKLMKHKRARK